MEKKINELTENQQLMIPHYRDTWINIGLSTEPANRDRAEEGCRRAYKVAGLQPPRLFIWLKSPLEGCYGAWMLSQVGSQVEDQVEDQVGSQVGSQVRSQVRSQVWSQVGSQVWSQVRSQVGSQVWDQVRSQVWDQVGSQVRSQVWSQVEDQVWSQVGSQVWDQVRSQVEDQVGSQVRSQVWSQVEDQVWSQVRSQVWDQVGSQVRSQVRSQVEDQVWSQVWDQVGSQVGSQVWTCGYGLHDAPWLSFYSFFAKECNISVANNLLGLFSVSQSCGWWWPFNGAVILTERPRHLSRDDQNRLHGESGAAIEYPDGFGVYAWHGLRVPEWIIKNPERITHNTIDEEDNAEMRRVLLERLGWENYIKASNAQLIHQDSFGKLYKKEIPNDEPLVAVQVVNSTPELDGSSKKYFLRVPPDIETAHQAVAWTFGMDQKDYQPIAET